MQMLFRQIPRARLASQALLRARLFHNTRRLDVVKPFMLADIGEGMC